MYWLFKSFVLNLFVLINNYNKPMTTFCLGLTLLSYTRIPAY